MRVSSDSCPLCWILRMALCQLIPSRLLRSLEPLRTFATIAQHLWLLPRQNCRERDSSDAPQAS